jgi:hypothetical protein
VEQARSGKNGKDGDNTTPTLSSFDMSQYDQFKESFDKFGTELSRAMQDKKLQSGIRNAVDATPIAPDGRSEEKSHFRDLKFFAQNVVALMGSDAPALGDSARQLLQSFDRFAVSQFGEKTQGQENVGGLSVKLPGKEIVDRKEVGRIMSPLHQLGKDLQDASGQGSTRQNDTVERIDASLGEVARLASTRAAEMKELENAFINVASAKSNEEFQSGIEQMTRMVGAQEKSKFGLTLAEKAERNYAMIWQEHKRDHIPGETSGWDAFIKRLDQPLE